MSDPSEASATVRRVAIGVRSVSVPDRVTWSCVACRAMCSRCWAPRRQRDRRLQRRRIWERSKGLLRRADRGIESARVCEALVEQLEVLAVTQPLQGVTMPFDGVAERVDVASDGRGRLRRGLPRALMALVLRAKPIGYLVARASRLLGLGELGASRDAIRVVSGRSGERLLPDTE